MKKHILTIVIAATTAILGFFGGMKYRQANTVSRPFNGQYVRSPQGAGSGMMQGRAAGIGRITGEILSVDDTGVTIRMPDGSSRIVIVSGTTVFTKSTEGNKADIKTGDRIGVAGTANSDGSITATDVQINPILLRTPDPTP